MKLEVIGTSVGIPEVYTVVDQGGNDVVVLFTGITTGLTTSDEKGATVTYTILGYGTVSQVFEVQSTTTEYAIVGPGVQLPSLKTIVNTSSLTTLTGSYPQTVTTTDSAGSTVVLPYSQYTDIYPVTGLFVESIVYTGPPSIVSTSTSSGVASSTTLPSGSASSSTNVQALSSGAKAGIGVGIAVAVLAALGFVYFLYRRRKRSKVHVENDDYRKPELEATAKGLPPAELPVGDQGELADSARHEMPADEAARELADEQVKRKSLLHEVGSP